MMRPPAPLNGVATKTCSAIARSGYFLGAWSFAAVSAKWRKTVPIASSTSPKSMWTLSVVGGRALLPGRRGRFLPVRIPALRAAPELAQIVHRLERRGVVVRRQGDHRLLAVRVRVVAFPLGRLNGFPERAVAGGTRIAERIHLRCRHGGLLGELGHPERNIARPAGLIIDGIDEDAGFVRGIEHGNERHLV